MVGIVSFGAYIPKYRISRDTIAQFWGSKSAGGEKALCSFDEDAITMAVEAAMDCLGDEENKKIDGLHFASSSAPFKEKQSSSVVAAALNIRKDITTIDFSGSLRAGSNALKAGIDAVQSGSAGRVLVAVSDCRLGAPESDLEQMLGDGSASILLGNSDLVANITGSYVLSDDFTGSWRTDQDRFVKSWEDRFNNIGYRSNLQESVVGIMNKYDLKPENFSKVVMSAPNQREYQDLATSLGFNVKSQMAESLISVAGNTGAAQTMMMLVATLEQAKAGDKILLTTYGDGSQAFIIEATENITQVQNRRGIKIHLKSKQLIDNYARYIRLKDIMDRQPSRRPSAGTSIPILWRQRKSLQGFYGSRCKKCSLIQHPVQRVCYQCGSIDEFEEIKLSKKGKIFSYTEDYIAPYPELPRITAIVILDDGARIYVDLIETEPQKPGDSPEKIGVPVEMTFRKISDEDGYPNYYWKARPERR